MAYNGLTNLGSAYLAKCMANKTGVTFTKIKVGNGSIPLEKTGQTTTDLYGFKKEVEILAKEQVDTALKLTLLLNNLDVVAGFYVKEMGIYIQDNGVEKLYWYINKDNPSYLPDKNTPSNHRYNLYLEVTPVETTIVNFTGQDLLADKKYVDDSIKNFQTENNAVIEGLKNTINTKLTKGSLPVKIADAKGLYDLIENNSGLNFDPNLIFLNDVGTKTQDKIYFDRNKKGLFRCTQTTTTTTNSTTYFEDISNKSSADRLTNLCDVGSNEYGSWIKYSNGILIQFGHIPNIRGEVIDKYFNLPTSFKDADYSITQGIWATSSSVFHITAYTSDKYEIEYRSSNGQNVSNLYNKSSFIAIGYWK